MQTICFSIIFSLEKSIKKISNNNCLRKKMSNKNFRVNLHDIIYEKFSDKGNIRKNNEDRYFIYEQNEFLLFIIADGMGGNEGGEVASKIAIEVVSKTIIREVQKYLQTNPCNISNKKISDMISFSLDEANEKIFDMCMKEIDLYGMGTTIVLCLIIRRWKKYDLLYVSNIGDSKLYILPQNINDAKYFNLLINENKMDELNSKIFQLTRKIIR